MAKSKSSSIVVPSVFAIHLMNCAQFYNAARIGLLCADDITTH